MGISSPGIGSNLDVNGIVTKLMQIESQPLQILAQKESGVQARLSAFGNISSALNNFQSALAGLSTPAMFKALSAVPADAAVFTATASGDAAPGTYNVNVTQLAQAQTIAAAGQASTSATIGSGVATTLSFQFGSISGGTLVDGIYTGAGFAQDASRASGTVNIGTSNNSLQGIRDAVNAANIGVSATIVADGSATPQHLVFTSTAGGASSSMKLSVSGDAALQSLLSYDPATTQNMAQRTVAQSTLLNVNGIAISSDTNSVTDAIQGVTLSVSKAGSSALTVSRNTSTIQTAANGFVKAYNDLNSTLSGLTAYNAATKTAGPLIGDSTVQTIQSQLRKTLSSSLTGLNSSLMSLPQVGITFQRDGGLALDAAKFQAALTTNAEGIGGLFATAGKTADSLITFASSGTDTKAGSYPVSVTALATRASVLGNVDLRGANTVIADDTRVNVTLDGTNTTLGLTPGSYNATQLASLVQSAINGTSTFSTAGSTVSATIDGSGFLNLTSNRYGAVSGVTLGSVSGSPVTLLQGAAPVATAGIDVAGSIGGMPATGSGQFLSAALGSVADGLKLQVSGGFIGARGNVDFSQGYADRLNKLVDGFIGSGSLIAGTNDGLNRSVKDIGKQRDALQLRLADTEKRYRAQFTALDVAIGSMTTTSTFLTQQLAAIRSQS